MNIAWIADRLDMVAGDTIRLRILKVAGSFLARKELRVAGGMISLRILKDVMRDFATRGI